MYHQQATLKIKRDKEHEIKKVTVIDTKNTLQLIQDDFGGQIHVKEYDSWEESKEAIKAIEASGSEQLVFIKSDDRSRVSAFFKNAEREK